VFAWLCRNKQWVFSGVGVGILGVFIALVPLAWRMIKPGQQDSTRVATQDTHPWPTASGNPSPWTNSPTMSEIYDTIGKMPPFQQLKVAEDYRGIKVDWNMKLLGVSPGKDDLVNLILCWDDDDERPGCHFANCTVSVNEYPRLKTLQKGSKIRIHGEIETVGVMSLILRGVTLGEIEAK